MTAQSPTTDSYPCAKAIKDASHRSYRNFYQAARSLQGKRHDPFGTPKVEETSISYTKRIMRECDMTLDQIEKWAAERMR